MDNQKRESHGVMFQIEKRLRISYKGGEMHIIVVKNKNYSKLTVNQNQGMLETYFEIRLWFLKIYIQRFSYTTKGEILEKD